MAWMLMTESPPRAPSRVEPRDVPIDNRRIVDFPGHAVDTHSTNNVPIREETFESETESPPGSRDAWILFGDIERALIQAGMLDALSSVLPTPERIFASGVSAVNALFSSRGGTGSITNRWESLRATHFLLPAALLRVAPLRSSEVLAVDLATKVRRVMAPDAQRTRTSDLVFVSEEGLRLPIEPARETDQAIWCSTLIRDDNAPASVAATISTIAKAGFDRVFVFGLDARLRGHPLVKSAAPADRDPPLDVCFLAAESNDSPGLLAYALPGLGGPERLIRDGRSAAQAWLEKNGRV